MEAFSKLVIITFVVIGIFVIPTTLSAAQQDQISQEEVSNRTVEFVNTVLNTGKLTRKNYNNFVRQLDMTNEVYDIEMVYSKYTVVPGKNQESESSSDIYYTDAIKNALFSYGDNAKAIDGKDDSELHLNKGSYFTVVVKNRTRTYSNLLQEKISKIYSNSADIKATYGGAIRDEVWD